MEFFVRSNKVAKNDLSVLKNPHDFFMTAIWVMFSELLGQMFAMNFILACNLQVEVQSWNRSNLQ